MSGSTRRVTPENMLTLHGLARGKTVPNLSPFVLKLETFFRMADIDYQFDSKKSHSPKTGKTPWVTLNGGIEMSDSQIIIEYLTKKLNIDLWAGASEEEKAMARLTRLAMEEHFNWGMIHWRWVEGFSTLSDLMDISPLKMMLGKLVLPRRYKKALHAQGLGRYPYEKMVEMCGEDLRNLSRALGQKSYWLGEDPTEIDCTLFGFLSQVMWGMPGSPYERLLKSELSNLDDYCIRMKTKFWPDFEKLLEKTE